MNASKIARPAVLTGLAGLAAVAGTPLATAIAAPEAGPNQGLVTINKAEGNEQAAFKGFQLFTAKVEDSDRGKTETDIEFASPEAKAAIEKAIKAEDPGYSGTTAQQAADFIAEHITGTDATTRVEGNSFAAKLARSLADGSVAPSDVKAGEATVLSEGYWLFVSEASDGTYSVGTAPIFAAVGGSPVTVTEKASLPTVSKEVKHGEAFGKATDSHVGQEVDYVLTGTLADNVRSFETYHYEFVDRLGEGLDALTDSVKVSVDGTVIDAGKYQVNYEGNVLKVTFENLLDAGVDVKPTSKVTVEYKAKLNSKAVLGGEGNPNDVELVYSNDPMSGGKGKSTPGGTTRDYAYKLHIHKVDRVTEVNLADVSFTIQPKGQNKFVQADGSLGDERHEFTTNGDGIIDVAGIASGTYTVTETASAAGYDAIPAFDITVTPTYNEKDGTLTDLAASLETTTADSVITGVTDGDTSDSGLKQAADSKAVDKATGTVTVTVGNAKRVGLPITGQQGVMLAWVAGGTVLAISMAHLIASRRRAED